MAGNEGSNVTILLDDKKITIPVEIFTKKSKIVFLKMKKIYSKKKLSSNLSKVLRSTPDHLPYCNR
jgi:predicted ATP-grasp superfamily ATP-dependent carboligase